MLLQVKAHFRPEFVNRVDDFVVFEALKLNEIKQIVRLQAKRVEDRLRDKKMRLELTDPAIDYLAVSPFTETCVTWAVRRHSSGVSCRADLADSWLFVPAHVLTASYSSCSTSLTVAADVQSEGQAASDTLSLLVLGTLNENITACGSRDAQIGWVLCRQRGTTLCLGRAL